VWVTGNVVWVTGNVVWGYSATEKEHQICLFLFQCNLRALKIVGHDYKIQFSTKQGDCDHETYT
jgi:hypothetical protein